MPKIVVRCYSIEWDTETFSETLQFKHEGEEEDPNDPLGFPFSIEIRLRHGLLTRFGSLSESSTRGIDKLLKVLDVKMVPGSQDSEVAKGDDYDHGGFKKDGVWDYLYLGKRETIMILSLLSKKELTFPERNRGVFQEDAIPMWEDVKRKYPLFMDLEYLSKRDPNL